MINKETENKILELWAFGYPKWDIMASLGVLAYDVEKLTTHAKNKIYRGKGYLNQLPLFIRNGYTEKGIDFKVTLIKDDCKLYCPFANDCNRQFETCEKRCTPEHLIARIKHGLYKQAATCTRNLLKREQKRKGSSREQIILKKRDELADKMDAMGLKYQDLPAWQVKELDRKTEQHNRAVGFNPRKCSTIGNGSNYSWLYRGI